MAYSIDRESPLDSRGRLAAAVALLNELTSSDGCRIDILDFSERLCLTHEHIEELISLLELVSDSNTGARVALRREGNTLALEGNAGRFGTVRLTKDEALSLMHVLQRFHISNDVHDRVLKALSPVANQAGTSELLSADTMFGGGR